MHVVFVQHGLIVAMEGDVVHECIYTNMQCAMPELKFTFNSQGTTKSNIRTECLFS